MRDNLPMADVPALPSGVGAQGTAVAGLVASFMGWVPAILAIIPAIYYLLLIYESKTVQGFFERRRNRRHKAK